MTWTTQRIETLKSLWAEGVSASIIAATLQGVTRNAVIGKAHRLKLAARSPGLTAVPQRRRSLALKIARADAVKSAPVPRPRKAQDLPELGPAPARHPVTADIAACHCRWPEGDPKRPGFHYCGRPPLPGASYCAHHFARAYVKPKPRKTDP